MLKFTTQEESGVLVVAFEATDDPSTDWQSTERDWLYKLIESHPDARFAIDLSQVNYLASSEIGFLVTLKRRIDRRQGRSSSSGLGPTSSRSFRTMNLIKILDHRRHAARRSGQARRAGSILTESTSRPRSFPVVVITLCVMAFLPCGHGSTGSAISLWAVPTRRSKRWRTPS